MKTFGIGCGVVLLLLLFIVVIAALAIAGSYNRLVRLQQSVDQSWAQVQNVYQRRADLIPNLVNTVSGAANFENANRSKQSANRCCTVQPISSRPGPIGQRAFASAGCGGALSRVKSQSELSQFAGTTGRNRKSNLG